MSYRLDMHRITVAAVYSMILVTMLAIFIGAGSFGRANPLLLTALIIVPAAAIQLSFLPMEPKTRRNGYWLAALLSIPLVVYGLPGGWGLLYMIGIIFLLWAGLVENKSRD